MAFDFRHFSLLKSFLNRTSICKLDLVTRALVPGSCGSYHAVPIQFMANLRFGLSYSDLDMQVDNSSPAHSFHESKYSYLDYPDHGFDRVFDIIRTGA